jgi:bifunctional DNA-binding transcriptional regulator/antitoxin component of YhaV-PrlF toxin-antitoxin module
MLDSSHLAEIIASDMTVSDKIRALDEAGYARADIARLLNKRYQHVRNVLEGDKAHPRSPRPAGGVAEVESAFGHAAVDAKPGGEAALGEQDAPRRGSGIFRLVVRSDGSVVLPREVREAFGVRDRGVVMAKLEGEEFKLISAAASLRHAQQLVRRYIPEDISLVDELLAERRREVEREERE